MKYPTIKEIQRDLGPGHFDFYRCYKCARIITREQERRVIARMNEQEEDWKSFCVCGSLKIYPLRRPHGFEWLKPNVAGYTLKLIAARGVAPWCEKNAPVVLPLIEALIRPKEARDG